MRNNFPLQEMREHQQCCLLQVLFPSKYVNESIGNFATTGKKSKTGCSSQGLSHLREHKFRHNFSDTIDPFCLCGTNDLETSEHFLLRCPNYAYLRLKLFDNLRNKNILLLPLENHLIVQILLFGSEYYDSTANKIIISSVIEFIIKSKRFEDALIQW